MRPLRGWGSPCWWACCPRRCRSGCCPRSRPVPLGRAAGAGVALALLVGLLSAAVPVWVLPTLAAVAGLVLLALPGRRWLGQSVLIAVAVSLVVSLLAIAGSARFPGAW